MIVHFKRYARKVIMETRENICKSWHGGHGVGPRYSLNTIRQKETPLHVAICFHQSDKAILTTKEFVSCLHD